MVSSLKREHHGAKVRCRIKSRALEGIVYCDEGTYYILQDVFPGATPHTVTGKREYKDYGHKYGWCVDDGSERRLDANQVTHVEILGTPWGYSISSVDVELKPFEEPSKHKTIKLLSKVCFIRVNQDV